LVNTCRSRGVARFGGSNKKFAKNEETAAERIGSLLHDAMYMLDALAEFAVLFKPVGIEHGVPVNAPHLSHFLDSL
jgi:hypothetical protein